MYTEELEVEDYSTTVHWVTQDELVHALELTQPAYCYQIGDELERLFSIEGFQPIGIAFLVSDNELDDDRLRQVLGKVAAEATSAGFRKPRIQQGILAN